MHESSACLVGHLLDMLCVAVCIRFENVVELSLARQTQILVTYPFVHLTVCLSDCFLFFDKVATEHSDQVVYLINTYKYLCFYIIDRSFFTDIAYEF